MFITPPRCPMEKVRLVDLIELNHERILRVALADQATEEEIQSALSEARIRQEDPLPSRIVFLLAYLLSLENVHFVAQSQPVDVNQILSSPRARQFADRRILAEEILACGSSAVLVPQCDTQLEMARETRRKVFLWQDRNRLVPKVILLTGCGMIALGKTSEDVCQLTEMTVKSAKTFVGAAILGGPVFMSPNIAVKIEDWS